MRGRRTILAAPVRWAAASPWEMGQTQTMPLAWLKARRDARAR